MAYLTPSTIAPYSLMPAADIADLDVQETGFIAARIAVRSSEMHSRIGKRYVRPFVNPIEIVKGWIGAMVTVDMYLKRGTNPQDQTFALIKEAKDIAEAQQKEAADAENGLFDLPLLDTGDATGIVKGAPRAYSEQSPYTAKRVQADLGRQEDRNR